uniref:Uncharacterized protein n=1 Tax=Panagrolaimus superbus TaxID=310955 RepID=A0A914Z5N0_9BILA
MVKVLSYKDDDEEVKKQWKKDIISSSDAINNSTLSLHITAYENLIQSKDAALNDEKIEEDLKREKSDLTKKWKNVNHLFLGSSFSDIENPFEFPRQQNGEAIKPGMMHFKASQRLLNPNERNSSVTVRTNITASFHQSYRRPSTTADHLQQQHSDHKRRVNYAN